MPRLVIILALLAPTALLQAAEPPSPIGRQVKAFTLQDYRGKEHSLADFKDAKLLVVAFVGTECPLAKLYGPRLAQLAEEYSSRGVAFVGIDSNAQDAVTAMAAYARLHNITFPLLKDLGNKVADDFGAQRTPEVFVLDADRTIRYHGRIDDQYGIGFVRNKPTRRDLTVALEELLEGKPVNQPQTAATGCLIGRARQPKADSSVTYSKDIAPLFQRRCQECHRSGDIAPFALTSYRHAAGWAETIAEVVKEGRMPPWHADPQHGKFANDRRLSEEEKRLLLAWVDAGAPEGDPKDVPPLPQFTAGWELPREPDLIVPMSDAPYEVQAEGVVMYQYFAANSGLKEDRWIEAIQVVPGNRAVVHHILVFAIPPGGVREALQGGGVQGYLAAYVPGLRSRPLPPGMAKRLPAGSRLVFQIHYTPNGSKQLDTSKVAFVFADPAKVQYEVKTISAANTRIAIPPRADNHEVEARSRAMQADALLLGMMPHMHVRGKAFRYDAVYADGKTETLLDVPRYDFNWQTSYRLAEPKPLPAGARVHCVAHYDNSESNLNNPDPTKTVRWGDQTWNEMMIGYFDIATRRTKAAEDKSPTKPEQNPD
jgi:peroxiredoxin/mono/diheme cytochrome c family protein